MCIIQTKHEGTQHTNKLHTPQSTLCNLLTALLIVISWTPSHAPHVSSLYYGEVVQGTDQVCFYNY